MFTNPCFETVEGMFVGRLRGVSGGARVFMSRMGVSRVVFV